MKINCPLCGRECEIDVEIGTISVSSTNRPYDLGVDTMLDITFRSARNSHLCEKS